MQRTIFSMGQGEGCILEHNERLSDFLEISQENIELGNTTLVFGEETTLCGWFDSPAKYCGRDKENNLYFYLGASDGDLFEQPKHYYETMRYLTQTRFFRMYSSKGGRDCNFVNGKWK